MTTNDIDLDAYFRRIGFRAAPRPDLATLNDLARRHASAIPFENLSPLLQAGVPLDLPSIERKLVDAGRGGYCFEQNQLFARALEQVGFEVGFLAARVLWNRPPEVVAPRGHMLLSVQVAGEPHIVDVGFGGLTLTGSLRLQADIEQPTAHEPFRLLHADGMWRAEACVRGEWRALYAFDLQPQHAVDYEAPNYWLSTHPQSHFVHNLLCARALPDRRLALLNRQFTVHRLEGGTDSRVLASSDALIDVLQNEFGIGGIEGIPALRSRLDALP
jgi:N-hydroxyarylamine O-acetyltransferase